MYGRPLIYLIIHGISFADSSYSCLLMPCTHLWGRCRMEVIPLIRSSATSSEASNGDNGIKRRVQEWSRLDRLTGILEHARVEADQWTNHTANTKHKFGKVCIFYLKPFRLNSKLDPQQRFVRLKAPRKCRGLRRCYFRKRSTNDNGNTVFHWTKIIFESTLGRILSWTKPEIYTLQTYRRNTNKTISFLRNSATNLHNLSP